MYHQTNFGCNTHTPHNRALLRCCHEWNRWTVTRLSWKVNTQNSKLKFHIRKFLFPTFVCLLCGPAAAHAHRWRLYQHGQPVSSTQMPESIARASHTHTHSALWFVCIVWLINRNYIALPAVAGFAVRDWLITMCPFGLRFIFPDDWVTQCDWIECAHAQTHKQWLWEKWEQIHPLAAQFTNKPTKACDICRSAAAVAAVPACNRSAYNCLPTTMTKCIWIVFTSHLAHNNICFWCSVIWKDQQQQYGFSMRTTQQRWEKKKIPQTNSLGPTVHRIKNLVYEYI